VGIIFGALYVILYGKKLGQVIFPNESKIWHILSGIFFILSFFSLFGAIIYYFYQINNFVITILLISSYFIIRLLQRIPQRHPERSIPTRVILPARLPAVLEGRIGGNSSERSPCSPRQFSEFFAYWLRMTRNLSKILLPAAYFITLGILIAILCKFSTTQSIRSPWHIIPGYFFIFYILATLLLIALIWKQKSRFSLLFIIIHTFFTFSIALIIYKLGYGFDPFIHQATENVILQNGFITPKPLYYLGQYSLVVALAKIFQSGIKHIDTFLVPVLFSIYIPSCIYLCLKSVLPNSSSASRHHSYALLATLAFLILPLSSFISTTPQALANIYAIIIIFLSFSPSSLRMGSGQPACPPYWRAVLEGGGVLTRHLLNYILIFLTTTAFAIHPLTGIPLIIFLILFFVSQKKIKFKKIIITLITIASSAALPIVFIINSLISNTSKISFKLNSLNFSLNIFNSERQYQMIRDFIYLYGFNIIPIFLVIAGIGIIIWRTVGRLHSPAGLWSQTDKMQPSQIGSTAPPFAKGGDYGAAKIFPYILTFLILLSNYIILKNFIIFESLISYEQNSYSLRILELSFYFLLPFFLISFYYFFSPSSKHYSSPPPRGGDTEGVWKKCYPKIFFLTLLSLWITASLYLTYPRYDNYAADRGYNVSATDFKAVEFIEQNAKSDYIVLANQNTSAAALSKYGFKKYFARHSLADSAGDGGVLSYNNSDPAEQLFYYPIPTSSPLYSYYLDMVNKKPSRETMVKAMELAGVSQGYFAVSKYWWRSDQIINRAKLEADEWYEVNDGGIYVFKYRK